MVPAGTWKSHVQPHYFAETVPDLHQQCHEPRAGDDGAAMGRQPLIATENILKLNEKVFEIVGMTQDSDDLVSSMQNLVVQDRGEDKGFKKGSLYQQS
jgi:hypothetical protein